MPRLPIPSDTDAFPEETREAMRHIHATRTTVPPPSSYLTHAGKAGALLSDLVEHMRYHTTLTQEETELAVCTAVRAADVDYIWGAHVRLGLAAGAREEAINAIDTFAPLDDLTPDEALIIGLMELTALMSAYTMNAIILRAVDHRPAADTRHLTPRPKA